MAVFDGKDPLKNKQKTDRSEDVDQPIPGLTADSLIEILPLLPVKELVRLERVCKLWQSAVNKLLMSIKVLDLSDCLPSGPLKQYQSGVMDILRSLMKRFGPQVTSLEISGYLRDQIGTAELSLVITKCPNLWQLCFELTPKSLLAMELLGSQLDQLHSLRLTYTGRNGGVGLKNFERRLGICLSCMRSLKHVAIECPTFGVLGPGLDGTFLSWLPNSVDSLSLSYLNRVSDKLLANFIRLHPQLKNFEMNTIWYDIRATVPVLARYCTGLKRLKITGSQSLPFALTSSTVFGEAVQSLTQLEQIYVTPNCCFTDLELQSICANCPDLRVLRMGNQHIDASLSKKLQNNSRLSLDGLNYLGELTKLKFVSLDCFQITITAEIVSALCEGRGAQVEDFHFRTNREPNGWSKFTEAGMNDFVRATEGQSCSKFFRIEVDRVGRLVWLKQSTNACYRPLRMENLHP